MTHQIINRKVTPLCFQSKKQYRDWVDLSLLGKPQWWICTDCTPEYQRKMISEQRCVQPSAKFIDKEGRALWVSQDKYDLLEGKRLLRERKERAMRVAKHEEKKVMATITASKRGKAFKQRLKRVALGEI